MFAFDQKVSYTKNGVTVHANIRSALETFYPQSTLNKYGNGSSGPAVRGYKVRGPIVQANGLLYMCRGEVAMGLGYVAADELSPL